MPRLTYNLQGLTDLADKIGHLEDTLAEHMPEWLEMVQDTWASAVSGTRLQGMEETVDDAAYLAAVQHEDALVYPLDGDPLAGHIRVQSDVADKVEKGRRAWDMKPGLLKGPKSKIGKRGQRYNRIPLGFNNLKPGVKQPGMGGGMMVGDSPWRTVSSDRTPSWAWWYPGVPGVHVRDAVLSTVMPDIQKAYGEVIQEWRR